MKNYSINLLGINSNYSRAIFHLTISLCLLFSVGLNAAQVHFTSGGQTGTSGTNWSISGNVLTVSGAATINVSVITNHLVNTGDLLVYYPGSAADIYVDNAITYFGPNNRTLTLRAGAAVRIENTIESTGPSSLNLVVSVNDNSNASSLNWIAAFHADVTTNGGHIYVGGEWSSIGTTTWKGLTVPAGRSVSYNDDGIGVRVSSGHTLSTDGGDIYFTGATERTGTASSTNQHYGIELGGATINTGGGDLTMIGEVEEKSYVGYGVYMFGGTSISTTTGTMTITGSTIDKPRDGQGVHIDNSTLSSTSGAIDITGTINDVSGAPNFIRIGIDIRCVDGDVSINSTSGPITLHGTNNATFSTSNDKVGVSFRGYNGKPLKVTSQTGAINIIGSNVSSARNFTGGIRFSDQDATTSDVVMLGYDGTNPYSGDLTIRANSIFQIFANNGSDGISIQSTGTVIIEPEDDSFTDLWQWTSAGGSVDMTWGSDFNFGTTSNLVFGKSTNTFDINVDRELFVNGYTLYNPSIDLDQKIVTTGTGSVLLYSTTGDITINDSIVSRSGTSTVTLRSDDIVTINQPIHARHSGVLNLIVAADENGAGLDPGVVSGLIELAAPITTQGGHVYMAGGWQDGANQRVWNSLTVPDGPAVSTRANGTGIDLSGGTITTSGGDIYVYGRSEFNSGTNSGNFWGLVLGDMSSDAGDITVRGDLYGQYDQGYGLLADEIDILSTSGDINITGVLRDTTSSESGQCRAIVLGESNVKSTSGTINITGSALGNVVTNRISFGVSIYMLTSGDSTLIVSQSGDVNITAINANENSLNGAIALLISELNSNENSIRIGYDGFNAYSGNINLLFNSLRRPGNNTSAENEISIRTTGTINIAPTDDSFAFFSINSPAAPFDADFNFGTTATGLTIGKSTNTFNLDINDDIQVNGPITLYGGEIDVKGNLTTTNGGDITIATDVGLVSDAGRTITTDGAFIYQPQGTSFDASVLYPITNFTITSNGLTLGKSGNTADLTITTDYTTAGNVELYGGQINLNNNLSTTSSGNLVLETSDTAHVAVAKALHIAGNFTNNSNLLLEGNASGGYSQLKISGTNSGTGTITQEMYIADGGWHMVGAGTNATTAAYFGGNASGGGVGSDAVSGTVNTQNLYFWDGTNWVNVTNNSSAITPGMGYNGYVGQYGFRETPNKKQSFTGSGLNTSTSVALTNSTAHVDVTVLNEGALGRDGWNLVANPFTCALDFSAFYGDLSNVNNAFYIWNPGTSTYEYYSGGGITDPYIAPLQAFWIQTTGTDNLNLSMADDGVVNQTPDYYKTGLPERLVLRSHKASDTTLADYTVLAFVPGTSDDYDKQWDALKFMNGGEVPTMFTRGPGNSSLAVNAIHFSATSAKAKSVPMSFVASEGEVYSIELDESYLEYAYNVELEDLLTGTRSNLVGQSYSFTMDTSMTDRFIVHLNNPAFTVDESVEVQGELVYRDGNPLMRVQESGAYKIQLMDLQGRILFSSTPHLEANESASLNLPSLPNSMYLLRVTNMNTAQTSSYKLIL